MLFSRRSVGFYCWACLLASCLLLISVGQVSAAPPAGSGYHIVRTLPVGGEGAWDYLALDTEGNRFFISRSAHVMVVDLASGKVVGDIPTKGVHGIALAYDLGRGYISEGGADLVTVIDLKTLKTISTISVTGKGPDFIIYDPDSKRVFTMNGHSANATAIDATTGQVVGTISFPGKPETAILDGKGSMFVNIEDKNGMVEFDVKTLAVKHKWSIAGCESPTGGAADREHRRLFVACDNNVMAVVNMDNGKVVAKPKVGGGPDAAGYDPSSGLAFASAGDNGVLSIIHEDSPDKYTNVADIPTKTGARTMVLDTKTHHIFTVSSEFTPPPAPTKEVPHPRPQALPGSFVILELAP
jgi:YVTN family beta-propeller protein